VDLHARLAGKLSVTHVYLLTQAAIPGLVAADNADSGWVRHITAEISKLLRTGRRTGAEKTSPRSCQLAGITNPSSHHSSLASLACVSLCNR